MNIRIFGALVMLGASALTLPQANAANIELWTSETESDRLRTIQALLDTFQALNPDVAVKLVAVEENETASQMAAASAAGTLPNLVIATSDIIVSFGQEGLLDTGSADAQIQALGAQRFYAGALRMLQANQQPSYFGVPFNGWIQGLWYRADWFAEAGLEPPDNWEAIAKAAEHFYKPEQNQYGILIGTDKSVYAEEVFTSFALSNGVREFDETGKLVFDSPEAVETLEFYRSLAKFGPPGPQYWRARDYYLQGKLAMFFYSTFIMDDLALADAAQGSLTTENFSNLPGAPFDPKLVENTGVITTITHKQSGSFGSIQGIGVLKGDTEEVEASRRLMAFLFEPAAYITWMQMSSGGFIPVLQDVAMSADYLADPKGLFSRFGQQKVADIMKGFESMGSFSVSGARSFPEAGQIFARGIIPAMIYATVFEGKDAPTAVSAAQGEMAAVLGR